MGHLKQLGALHPFANGPSDALEIGLEGPNLRRTSSVPGCLPISGSLSSQIADHEETDDEDQENPEDLFSEASNSRSVSSTSKSGITELDLSLASPRLLLE